MTQIAPGRFEIPQTAAITVNLIWLVPPLALGWILVLLHLIERRLDRIDKPIAVTELEATLRQWADASNWRIRRIIDPTVHFAFEITTDSGHVLAVSREKNTDCYITASSLLSFNTEHRAILDGLDVARQGTALGAIRLALIDRGVEYKDANWPLRQPIQMWQRVLLTHLSEPRFSEAAGAIFRAQSAIVANVEALR